MSAKRFFAEGHFYTPDRKARFKFVMPALSADPAVRERWFTSLRDVSNRRREPWVLEGLGYAPLNLKPPMV